ncbi:hypothetical protein [Streptomyces broussonetiae]|nr:hypothetical protein [Streptomyces broussonetiae]
MTQQDPIDLLIAIEEASVATLGDPLPLPAPHLTLDTAPFVTD